MASNTRWIKHARMYCTLNIPFVVMFGEKNDILRISIILDFKIVFNLIKACHCQRLNLFNKTCTCHTFVEIYTSTDAMENENV